jgi:hypothetical protein
MNYLEIVLQGYFNDNSREYLEEYFLRAYKRAESEQFFGADEFFNGCLNVIEGFEACITNMVLKRKWELQSALGAAERGTLSYNDMEGKTIEQKNQETIENCKKELEDIRPDGVGNRSFTIHLFSITNGRFDGHLTYDEILQIKLSIYKAFNKAQSKVETPPPQPEKQKPELLSDLLAHQNGDKIINCIKVKYKNIKGKRLKLLLLAFQDLELLPKDRIAKKFHNCCKSEFNWEIGSYNAMNGYKFNNVTDSEMLKEMTGYIQSLKK